MFTYDFITKEFKLENLEEIKKQVHSGIYEYQGLSLNGNECEQESNNRKYELYCLLYDYLSFTLEEQERLWKHYFPDTISEIDTMLSDDEKFDNMLTWFCDLDYEDQEKLVIFNSNDTFVL